ncbi:MAG: hypothetical protein B6D55_07490 [Candidatus Omnitrophica bacterium 4484_70.2]|nr:MAG: hypothetical protein B6D55_07490 [Candidatus Omnitrophica bacterium 4484_70.2]
MSVGKKYKIWVFMLFLTFALTNLVWGAITISQRTGSIKIIYPDGKEVIVAVDEELPSIPDGSTIIILSGSAEITATEDSFVNVQVGSTTAYLDGGDSLEASFNPDTASGNLNWLAGEIEYSTLEGEAGTLYSSNPSFSTDAGSVETEVVVEEDSGDITPSE